MKRNVFHLCLVAFVAYVIFFVLWAGGARAEDAPAPAEPDVGREICTGNPCVARASVEGAVTSSLADQVDIYVAAVARHPEIDHVELHIDSPGGEFNAGARIFKALATLRLSKTSVVCVVEDDASSVAFWILQACSIRVAHVDSTLVLHEIYILVDRAGVMTRKTMEDEARHLRRQTEAMVTCIAHRSGLSPSYIGGKISRGDWVISPEDARRMNLIDRILYDKE